MQAKRPTGTPARRGFTLVELLVVVAIIAVLLSLGTAAFMKARDMQMRRNSEQVVIRTSGGLYRQTRAAVETAKAEQPTAYETQLAGGDDRRARVIHVLAALRREFPSSFAEALAPGNGIAPNPAYVRALQNVKPGRSAEDESSACLYLALKQTRRGGDFDPDTALSSAEVVDPFGDGIKEIYDGWGRPIIFVRWPSGIPALNPGGPVAFNPSAPADTEDPEGLLTNAAWQQQYATSFTAYTGYPLAPAGTQYKLVPTVYSKGSDGKPLTADDLYSFQLSPLSGKNR